MNAPLERRRYLWFAPLASTLLLGVLAVSATDRYRFMHQYAFVTLYASCIAVAGAICWLERPKSSGAPRWMFALVPLLLTVLDVASLVLLVSLVRGNAAEVVGWNLLITALVTWALNVVTFALWY